MSAILPLIFSSLSLAGIFFLLASGLSLVFGLMRVLNLAHGAVFGASAYVGYSIMAYTPIPDLTLRFIVAAIGSTLVGAVLGLAIERVILRPFYGNGHVQMLVTLGLSFAIVAVIAGSFGHDPLPLTVPGWFSDVTVIAGSRIANSRIVIVAIALILLAAIMLLLRKTNHGLIIRAGVENRQMVTALGINVTRSFTLVFVIGSALAGIGGLLAAVFYGSVNPDLGTGQVIFAFIVIVIGGLGSVEGTALAAVVVGLLQQFFNYYGPAGAGDIVVVVLLAIMLLVRPKGILGKVAV